jgi:drug/metabolite transporter (DMT)-like permease
MDAIHGTVGRPHHPPPGKERSKLQTLLVVLIATLCTSVGETLLSVGMRSIGREDHDSLRFVLAAMTNRYVIAGVLLMMVFFALYSLALSWADISFVLPFTALSYLFIAIFARIFLHENVTPTRWIGTVLIVIGVIIVGLGERELPR